MKELPSGEFAIYNRDDFEEAAKKFLEDRMISSWRDKIDMVPKRYPCVCRFVVFPDAWDVIAVFTTMKEYKAAAKKVWLEIEAL